MPAFQANVTDTTNGQGGPSWTLCIFFAKSLPRAQAIVVKKLKKLGITANEIIPSDDGGSVRISNIATIFLRDTKAGPENFSSVRDILKTITTSHTLRPPTETSVSDAQAVS